ncbi:MAG: hypothetical protein IPM48_00905 [Saprospiraceae bacterium]|nr:hypothetical protein [Saprospiraceae bacterium]
MPIIVLTQAFLFHYAGTVLELPEELEIDGWNEDERLREKMDYRNKQCYHLPDNGRGKSCLLPIHYTKPCPVSLLPYLQSESGPCRITSTNEELRFLDPSDLTRPTGNFSELVRLEDASQVRKTIISLESHHANASEKMMVKSWNSIEMNATSIIHEQGKTLVDCSLLPAGFYALHRWKTNQFVPILSFIKMFPLVVNFDLHFVQFETTQTIW